jgi:hypothetical protein
MAAAFRPGNEAAGVLGRTAVADLAIAARYGCQLDAIVREVQLIKVLRMATDDVCVEAAATS